MMNKKQRAPALPEGEMGNGRFVRLIRQGQTASLLLDRPERANAYNQQMLNEFDSALDELETTSDVNVLVIRSSTSKYFCSGADLNEISVRTVDDVMALRSREVFDRIAGLSQVTVAAVSGAAAGGGLELALACDIRICSASARFWLPETQLGLIPAAGGIWRLSAIAGRSVANEMILAGRMLKADDAVRCGLAGKMVAEEYLEQAVAELVEALSARDPLANGIAKHIIARTSAPADGFLDKLAQVFLTARKNGGDR